MLCGVRYLRSRGDTYASVIVKRAGATRVVVFVIQLSELKSSIAHATRRIAGALAV